MSFFFFLHLRTFAFMNRFIDTDCSFERFTPIYSFYAEELDSLENALQPIEFHIKQLPYFIKTAKKHCYYPNEHGLSRDQSAAIYIFTMEWGETSLNRLLNQALRSKNRDAVKIWFPYMKLFVTALDLLPTVEDTVWKLVPLDIAEKLTPHQTFTCWSFSSCTTSIDVCERFLNDKKNLGLFAIEITNGKKISQYAEIKNENEVILPFESDFYVKETSLTKHYGNHYIVELSEIAHENKYDQSLLTHQLRANRKWKQYATTVAGGNHKGNQSDQLYNPLGIYINDEQQAIYIADFRNDRIVQWRFGANNGEIIVGEDGKGNRIDQLSEPTDVIFHRRTKSLIICDKGNRRVMRWSIENPNDKQIIISNISCYGLTMNDNEDLFVSDYQTHEVRKWKKNEKHGTIVAGGNGRGDDLTQLNRPGYIFVDRQNAVYISDRWNHRIVKWEKDAKQGIIVAGGHGQGNSLKQLSLPQGIIVNEIGDVFIADYENHRIMCWPSGSQEGRLILGGNGQGQESNQLNNPMGLSFDRQNNLYIVDCDNHRVQRLECY